MLIEFSNFCAAFVMTKKGAIKTCCLFCPELTELYLGVHTQQSHSGHVLGLLLAQQRSRSSQGRTGGDHCPHHDHPHQLRQRRPAQNILHEVHRHLSVCLFLHGVRSPDRVRLCRLHRQENPAEEEPVSGPEEHDGGEEERDGEADGAAGGGVCRDGDPQRLPRLPQSEEQCHRQEWKTGAEVPQRGRNNSKMIQDLTRINDWSSLDSHL